MTDFSPTAAAASVKLAKHGSESGRWYTQAGDLVLEVPKKDGGTTKPTLAHARKMQLAPGVTGVIKQVLAPQLVTWMLRQAVLSALTLPRRDSETEKEYLDRIEEDMDAQRDKAAAEGTKVHAALQAFYGDKSLDPAYCLHVGGIAAMLDFTLGKSQVWRPEVAVVSPLGYATKIDLMSDEWVLDFKGKDGDKDALAKMNVYDEHEMQLAAGIAALGQPRRAAIVFFSRTHPGVCAIKEVEKPALERGGKCFRALLRFWQEKHAYRPEWASEEA